MKDLTMIQEVPCMPLQQCMVMPRLVNIPGIENQKKWMDIFWIYVAQAFSFKNVIADYADKKNGNRFR